MQKVEEIQEISGEIHPMIKNQLSRYIADEDNQKKAIYGLVASIMDFMYYYSDYGHITSKTICMIEDTLVVFLKENGFTHSESLDILQAIRDDC